MGNKNITQETLKALREEDHKAFELIFVTYFNRIKLFINSYIKSEIDAEELTEDLFVNLWYNRFSIDPEKPFNAFMHTMARNAAINFLKHKRVHASYMRSLKASENTATSEEEVIAKETALLIEIIVERMPAQRRQVYLLSRKDGLTNEKIAEQLNISKTNVESHLSLALKDIRKYIASFLMFIP